MFGRRKRSSLLKRFEVPALTAGEIKDFDEENTLRNVRQFSPFSSIKITNLTASVTVRLTLDYSPDKSVDCVAGGVRGISGIPFTSFQVINLDDTTATGADDVEIELEG